MTSVDRICFGTSAAAAAFSHFVNDISMSQPAPALNEIFDEMGYDAIRAVGTSPPRADTSAQVRRTPSTTDRSLQLTDTNPAGKVEVWRTSSAREAFTASMVVQLRVSRRTDTAWR